MLPTRKVLCESWVAESLDDAIVRALSTSHRAGPGARISCTEILCVAGVRDLVRKKVEGSICWGPIAARSGRNTWETKNVGAAKGRTEPPSRSAGMAANPCALAALAALAFVGGCIAGATRAWRGCILGRVRPVHLEMSPAPSLFTWMGLA